MVVWRMLVVVIVMVVIMRMEGVLVVLIIMIVVVLVLIIMIVVVLVLMVLMVLMMMVYSVLGYLRVDDTAGAVLVRPVSACLVLVVEEPGQEVPGHQLLLHPSQLVSLSCSR